MTDKSKPCVKIYYEEVERHYVRKNHIIVNEDTHPQLKGMDHQQMVQWVKDNMEKMEATEDGYGDIMEQAEDQSDDRDKYIFDSREYVVEPYFPDQEEEYEDENDDEDDEDYED